VPAGLNRVRSFLIYERKKNKEKKKWYHIREKRRKIKKKYIIRSWELSNPVYPCVFML
jgi:hypothetical protein